MRFRRLALLITLYLSLDLTNPFIGCAFNFNVEESVDGVSRQHERLLHQTDSVATPVPWRVESGENARPVLSRYPELQRRTQWFVKLGPVHAPASDPQSPTEDH